MKSADFNYHRPREVNEALTLLKEVGEEGKILAGGQSLMPMMNFRLAEPAHLVDINFIDGLDYIRAKTARSRSAVWRARRMCFAIRWFASAARCLPPRWLMSGMSKRATAAPYAAAWRTPIRQRSCRRCCSR